MIKPSKFDNDTFALTREHLNSFINKVAKTYGESNKKLLEIGSQDRSEVKSAFSMCNIETLDLTPDYNPDIIGDITKYNSFIMNLLSLLASIDKRPNIQQLKNTLNKFVETTS